MTIDNNLNELKRIDATQDTTFGIRAAYRLPDMSVALFGFGVHSDGGYFSQARLFTPDLKSSETLDLDRGKIDDFGTLSAVVSEATGAFVAATSAVAKGGGNPEPSSEGRPENFSRGAVIDFLQFKQRTTR